MKVYELYFEGDLIRVYKYYRCLIKYVNKMKDVCFTRDGVNLLFEVHDNEGNIFFV